MAFSPPKASKPPKLRRSSTRNWMKGIVKAFDAGRTPVDGLITGSNIILDQDGTVRPRQSLRRYGPQPVGTVLGEVFEYKVQSGATTTMHMCCLQNVAGVTKFYRAKGEDAVWTVVGSKTYDNDADAHFIQVQGKVLIMNGTDNLSYYDPTTDDIVVYTPLADPAAPTLDTETGLTGTAFKVYYAVTANSTVGETAGSPVLQQTVSTDRDMWNPDTQNVKIKWTAVPDAESYNVYVGIAADGAGQPKLYAIATGLDSTTLSFMDNGTRQQQLARPLPTKNSTAGPKATRGAVITGRPWLTGDTDNPYYVWHGGDFGHELDFSPANGGGFTSIGNGTKEVPASVVSFRDGKGDQKITVLTQGSNGSGKRYLLAPREITYGSNTFIVWETQEDTGNDGTDAPDAVVIYNNSIFYPSREGFKTTGTQPQLQNVLSTDRISNTIQPDISRLNTKAMHSSVGVAYEGRIYWALPVGANRNNEVWVLDLDREGAWMQWSMFADWMWLYNDNNGVTHFLVLQGNVIYELTKLQYTNDDGAAFITNGSSGQQWFSEDGMDWARLIRVVFTLSRPQGRINLEITGMTEDGPATFTGGDVFGVETTVAGWGEPSAIGLLGFGRHAWGETSAVPEASGVATKDIEIEINEDVKWWQYSWNSQGLGANYQIANVTAEYVTIGTKDID